MNYYIINPSDDLKVIGHYPQTKLRVDEGDNVRVDGYLAVRAYEFPDFTPKYKLILHPRAKPTNFLPKSPASFGLVVDKKLKFILENHKLPKHHFYKIKVYHKDIELEYYWLHFIVNDFWKFIDHNTSYAEYFKYDNPLKVKVLDKIPIINNNQIMEETKKYDYGSLRIGKVVMKNDFPQYDLYETQCINYITIISETLKHSLEKEGITGMEIKPFDKFELQVG